MPHDDAPVSRVVARVGKPHGLRGEVTVEVLTDDPASRLAPGTVVGVDVEAAVAERGPLTVNTARVHHGVHLLGFEGVSDRSAAERLRGLRLLAGNQERRGPRHGAVEEYYEDELVGLHVELPSGAPVGHVSALITRPAQDLLEVRTSAQHTALVPFVSALVPLVDVRAGRVVIDPPPGLLELDV